MTPFWNVKDKKLKYRYHCKVCNREWCSDECNSMMTKCECGSMRVTIRRNR